jgi:hypothetical protein
MMSQTKPKTKVMSAAREQAPRQPELSEEEKSKDAFFVQLGEIAEAMIARHGRDFAIGTMILSARFIAEGKPLIDRTNGGDGTASAVKPV